MYNLRYHLASLVAVFLALALGLVLGGLVVQRGTFDRQQERLVDGLRKEFASLNTNNRLLTAQNEVLSGYAGDMTDEWVADKLVGKTVLVLVNPGRTDGLTAAVAAIESAGGVPVVVTLEKPGLGLKDPEVAKVASEAVGPSDDLLASTAASLVAEWAAPLQERPLTAALTEAGVISVEDLEPGTAVSALVDLAVFAGDPDVGGLELAQAAAPVKLGAVVGQTPRGDAGLASAAAAAKLATLDTLGSDIGRYSLVALLTGAKAGYYGLGQDAVAPYPPLQQP